MSSGTSSGGYNSRTDVYKQPDYDWQAEQRRLEQERLRRERERKQRLYKQAEEEAKSRDEERSRQFEQNKHNALELLKSGVDNFGFEKDSADVVVEPGYSSGTTSGLQLKGTEESDISKGTQYSAPVDLSNHPPGSSVGISPDSLKMDNQKQQGLRTNYVPKPSLHSLDSYRYETKTRSDIIFDALEVGRDDLYASVRHLENYLEEVNPDSLKVQEALSYIQGMAEGQDVTRKKKQRESQGNNEFAPSADDSRYLLDAVAEPPEMAIRDAFLKPKKPEVPIWKRFRDEAITETIAGLDKDLSDLTRADFQQCIDVLQARIKEKPDQEGLQQAVEFFKGIRTYY